MGWEGRVNEEVPKYAMNIAGRGEAGKKTAGHPQPRPEKKRKINKTMPFFE